MTNITGLIDYGEAGNIASIQKALIACDAEVKIIYDPIDISSCKRLILPGVGAFNSAMEIMTKDGWTEEIKEFAKTKPILGICLGMQILSKVGFEFGETEGLKLINAEVKLMSCKGSIPHIGFKKIDIIKKSNLFNKVNNCDEFYFMHSYEVINYTDISALCNHGSHTFVCAVENNNVYGVQFHPEKSRGPGITILRNFINL